MIPLMNPVRVRQFTVVGYDPELDDAVIDGGYGPINRRRVDRLSIEHRNVEEFNPDENAQIDQAIEHLRVMRKSR